MTADTEFMTCPQCGNARLKVKPTKMDTLFVACMGYPQCKHTMDLPRGIIGLEMLSNKTCSKCARLLRTEVYKFRLTFDGSSINESVSALLPDQGNTSGEFCIVRDCDEDLGSLIAATKYNNGNQ